MPKYTCSKTNKEFTTKKDYVKHLESIVNTIEFPQGKLAISLFSGAGGDTLGIENAGCKVVAFSENNPQCILTHQSCFPESKLLGKNSDISKITDDEFREYVGKIFLIFAGFPCQGFSNAGKKSLQDPRNKMFYHFVRSVNIIRPEWIMGENVSGLLTRKNDDGKSSVIETIQNHFNDIGYNIVFNVYDLSTIGVPQTRKRLVIIGNRLSIQLQLPKFNEPKRGIVDIIEPVLEGAIETTLELPEYCYITIPDTVEITGTPHPFLVLKHEANQISYGKRESPNHSEILDLRNPCKTIICAYTFQPRLYVGLKKENGKTFIRCLTIPEAAQIQGFPKTHKFHGNYSQIIKQIGNAVPPLFIQRMTELILQHS